MDKRVHEVSLARLVCQAKLDRKAPLVFLEILEWMAIMD